MTMRHGVGLLAALAILAGCPPALINARIKLPKPSTWSGERPTGVVVFAADLTKVCERAKLYAYPATAATPPIEVPDLQAAEFAVVRAQGDYEQGQVCTATVQVVPGDYWVVAEYPSASEEGYEYYHRGYEWAVSPEFVATRCLGAGASPLHVAAPSTAVDLEVKELQCRAKALAPTVSITQEYCPTTVEHGDREFDGHGPNVEVSVQLWVRPEGTAIDANLSIRAEETGGDHSRTTGSWWIRDLYLAPKKLDGTPYLIAGIAGPSKSHTFVTSVPGGFQFVFPGGSSQVQTPPVEDGAFVAEYRIVGDTGGNDISDDNDCSDDTRFSVVFRDVEAILRD